MAYRNTIDRNGTSPEQEQQRAYQRIRDGIRNTFTNQGEESPDTEALMDGKRPERPLFPYFIFGIAIFKDALDIADVTFILMIITYPLSILMAIILFVWLWGKTRHAGFKKILVKFIWKRFIIATVVEFIPGFKLIPSNMILILMVHNKHLKIVQLLDNALDELSRSGLAKYIK